MTYGLGTKMYMSVEVAVQNIWIFCLAFPQTLRLCAVRNHPCWGSAVDWFYFGVSCYAVAQREKLIILLGCLLSAQSWPQTGEDVVHFFSHQLLP